MEPTQRFKNSVIKLQKAYLALEKACKEPKNEYVQDSVIQRFEFTFELLWKTLKEYLLVQWIEVFTPRQALLQAYKIGLLSDIEVFLNMKDCRNLTSHTYNEELAEEVYLFACENLHIIFEVLEKLLKESLKL